MHIQAVILVQNQHPPSGKVPKGFYIATSEVTPSMFDHQVIRERNKTIKTSMPFLFNLIKSAFDHSHQLRLRERKIRQDRHDRKKASGNTHLRAVLPLEDVISSETNKSVSMDDSYTMSANIISGVEPNSSHESMILDDTYLSPSPASQLYQNRDFDLNTFDSSEASSNSQSADIEMISSEGGSMDLSE